MQAIKTHAWIESDGELHPKGPPFGVNRGTNPDARGWRI